LQKKPFFKGARPKFTKKEDEHRINGRIIATSIRLVGDNVEPGIYTTDVAQKMADEQDLDLVEITPNAEPPICKIVDYKKFLFERKKKEKEIKANTTKVLIKEIRFTANTDEHDVDFKAKHGEKFLLEGNKVKCFVMFRGRDIIFQDRAKLLLRTFAEKLEDVSTIESEPKTEGRRMFMTLAPKAKKK
jgi:translation initiation factor IF-3